MARDALSEYRSKRDFRRTSEPSGGEPSAGDGWSFVVHEHDAQSLHYDFRLELDGVLATAGD